MRLLATAWDSTVGRPGDEIDPAALVAAEVRSHTTDAPWVFTNMVMSIDGSATLDGRSAGLGGPADRTVFSALRDAADVIVVGAETVRTERYRLPRAPVRLCIVTRSSSLPGDLPLFDELPAVGAPAAPWQRPLVATTDRSAAAGGHDDRLEVAPMGDDSVDLRRLIDTLGTLGLRRVLCEGGPSLLGQLGAAGLVDEWNFTVGPMVVGGSAARPVHSDTSSVQSLMLDRLMIDDDSTMFARYVRSPDR